MANSFVKYLVVGSVSIALLSIIVGSDAKVGSYNHAKIANTSQLLVAIDTPITEEDFTPITLPYHFEDQSNGDALNYPNSGGLMLNNPSNVNTNVEYDPTTGTYIVTQKMGDINYRPPTYLDGDEYQNYLFKKQVKDYWNARTHADSKNSQNSTVIPKLHVGGEIFDRIFGGNTVDIRPNGSAELIFAYQGSKNENPALPVKQRSISTFNFDEKIQLNVVGKIGDKLKLTTSYNTQATFDYENQMKLEYTGYEDEIIKKIEAGNVSMPLTGSLITGSQTLFGIKTQLQFGRLTITSILSQEKGKKSEVNVAGGAQISKFEIAGDAYEANKHFFLAQYFRDNYNSALAGLPFINSGIVINRIEVWISNANNSTTDIRNVVAFSELAEDASHIPADQTSVVDITPNSNLPYNDQNDWYGKIKYDSLTTRLISKTVSSISSKTGGTMKQQTNYELMNARKLQATEYTFNSRLGFVSLNQQLNADQALAVAYQYTYNGQVYQVGEFSDGGISAPKALFAKMLKSTATNTKHPMWNLMMKNVYSIGSYQISPKDFKLDIIYTNSATGTDINYLPVPTTETAIASQRLIQVLDLDKLNQQNDKIPDGVFDYIDGVTINSTTGRVIFPVIEPFGDFLYSKFVDQLLANKYVFNQLYDSTRTSAQQFPTLNRFKLKGQYQSSSSSEISLGSTNVPQGSVTVTAGGVKLTENVDYTVDYTLGRVKIINEGILNSGTPIKVSSESNALFAIQQKTLMGTHLDFRINKDFNIGGTIMNLKERPLTQKVNQGDEPISNTIWGLDGNYRTDAPFLTRWIDKIPLISTKEMSTITASAEFAYLIPGHSKAIGSDGNSYIDDFEGSQSTIDLRAQSAWSIASTPQGQPSLFPEGTYNDSLVYGYNRAKLAWYVIDPLFLRKTDVTPSHLSSTDLSNNFTREIIETEVFPNKPSATGIATNIATLDMAYYPSERGPYNYDTYPTSVSAGLDSVGNLKKPQTRWGGMMRSISSNDFEAANIEYIQFWVMDPFNADNNNPNATGDLYFNLGNVSEDVLRDGYRSAENGLPTPNHPADTVHTNWGVVPVVQPLVNAFNSEPEDRPYQDVGLDGMVSGAEKNFYSNYLAQAQTVAFSNNSSIANDPSGDDFHYFRGDDYDNAHTSIKDRYKNFNGTEGNSSAASGNYPTAATTIPNVEDINRDNSLSTVESYFQYHISLKPSDFAAGVGNNYITDVHSTSGQNIKDGSTKPIKWYQFKIPLKSPEDKFGSIDNFQSIRFIRMFFKNVDKPILLRFARLELIRAEWRKYGFDLLAPGAYVPNDDEITQFDVSAVNIEENGSKQPVNYVLPPGIERQTNAASANLIAMNEQAMSLTVCNLQDGQSRAAFKNTNLDVRSYKKLKMYIHAEASANTANVLHDDDLHTFIRLGSDYTDNYYEYEIPLKVTPAGNYNGSNTDDQYRVWPEANEMILEFSKLQAAKQQRNNNINGSTITLTKEYSVPDGSRIITVKGNPNLSAIRTLMIGVRNPKKGNSGDSDDGLSKCGQVWVNELRLSDFNEEGGWAANARVTAKLADLGTLSLSGNMYTPGFGSIENKVSERKRETLKQYDISSSLELGKFLPKDYNIHVPVYMGFSETYITPQYNPLDPDILLNDVLKSAETSDSIKNYLKKTVLDYTKRKSINFTNVKKDKGKNSKKSHIYDVENWAASYSYSELYHRNVNIEYNTQKTYHGGLMYNFSPTPKNIKPFAKTKMFQSKYLQILKDVNFYLMPNKLGFSTNVDRLYSTAKDRNTTGDDFIITPTFNKTYNMNRSYDLKYDITKALKLDFTANNLSRVLEPEGAIDTDTKKAEVRNNFWEGGKTTQYNHLLNINYTIPINKLPFLDFTSASVRYAATYTWQRAPFNADSMGNTIQNSKNIQLNGQLTMTTLYNKIPYLKRINQKVSNQKNQKDAKGGKSALPNLKGNDTDSPADSTKKAKDNSFQIVDYVARLFMSLKTVTFTYSTNEGTLLPGYNKGTQMMGMDEHFDGPSVGFIFGSQKDIRGEAISKSMDGNNNNDWLVKTSSLNTFFTQTYTQNLNLKATVEPLPDFKIELSANQTRSKNHTETFKWVVDTLGNAKFDSQSPVDMGSFSTSYNIFGTSFKNGDDVFQNFLNDRSVISSRVSETNHNSIDKNVGGSGFTEGYNATSQEVLIPAFLAAYSGKNATSSNLDKFPKIPKLNWTAKYDGLSKLNFIKKYFKSFTLSHAYRSTYSVGGFKTNLLYSSDQDGFALVREEVSSIANNPNFISKEQIDGVTISENWSPLIKVDAVMNNSILVSFEYKRDRNLSLGLTSKSITEVSGKEIIGGLGYRIKDVKLGKNIKIKGKPIKSDLNLKADLSYRKNTTTMRRIVEQVSQSIGGTNILSIKVSADYVINERINIRAFYEWMKNIPVISTSFVSTNTNAGISIRLTLSN